MIIGYLDPWGVKGIFLSQGSLEDPGSTISAKVAA